MIEAVVALFSVLPSSPAVVRFASGPVTITSTGAVPAGSGTLIPIGGTIDTGPDGFAEIHLAGRGRVRMSAATRAVIGSRDLRLLNGRIWVQVGASQLAVHMVRHRAELGAKTSAIIERTIGGGTAIVVRAGQATLSDLEGARRELEEGQTVRMIPGVTGIPEPQTGGRGTAELVTHEARRAMKDPLGIEAFLLSRSLESELRARSARGVHQQVRSASELAGAEGGAYGGLVEDTFRPPPFFEAEVPPKGPNVRVEVEFGDE